MADRRSQATKSAGQAPSTTQTSKEKAAAAVATQQANKGLSQKDLALKYGGRYSEGGSVYQVGAPQQQDSRTNEQRAAQFEALNEKDRDKARRGKEAAETRRQAEKQTSTSKYAYDEYGEASAPAIESSKKIESVFYGPPKPTARQTQQQTSFITPATITQQPSFIHPGLLAQAPQQPPTKQESRLDNLLGKNINLERGVKPIIPIASGVYRGTLEITSIGVAVGTAVSESAKQGKLTGIKKGTQEAEKFIEKYKPAEYPPGSREDIQQKIGSAVPLIVAGGVSGGIKGLTGTISKGLQVSKVEKFLAKTEPGIKSGREKLGPETYLISRGTEKTPAKIPYTLVEFGQRGFRKPGIATPIIPSEVAPLSPSRMFVRGKLDPTTQKILGTKQTGPFTYEAAKTTAAGRQTYQRGAFEKQLKVIAEAKPTLIKDIGSPKFHKEFGELSGRTIFGETKAERFNVIKSSLESRGVKPSSTTKSTSPFTFGPSMPSKVGAGSAGKARGFSAQESRVIKELVSAKPITKQQPDILFSSPRFIVPSSILEQQTQEQAVRYPPTEKTINIF